MFYPCSPSDHEQCDGCGQGRSASELLPIGDGSIQVCASCHKAATAMGVDRLVS